MDSVNREKLKALFAELHPGQLTGIDMKCVCLPDPVTGITTVVDHIRVFPRHPKVRWKYRVHEQILPAIRSIGGTVRFADVQIHHVGYQDPALRGRKLERDIRLLNLENEEHPEDPFTLFNLGSVYLEQGKTEQAIPLLERSLARSHPSDSIVRKLYALLVQAHKRLAHLQSALAICEQGRRIYPHDAELLFQEGLLRRDLGDLPGAAKALEQLLQTKEADHFASVDVGLGTFKARHNLAVIYRDMGRIGDAIGAWKLVLQEAPEFYAARIGLAETYLRTQDQVAFEEQLIELQKIPSLELDVQLLQAKRLLVSKSYDEAKTCLVATIAKYPDALAPKVILSHAYLQEGRDWKSAEQALLKVVELDPSNKEGARNLMVLRKEHADEL